VPILLEIGRENVRAGDTEEALLAEAEAIIAEATGDRDPTPVKAPRRRPAQASLFNA
jgi:ATP-dependent Lhr-like helicase